MGKDNDIRLFYQTFPDIFATPWRILTWSHYKRLIQVPKPEARTCFWLSPNSDFSETELEGTFV